MRISDWSSDVCSSDLRHAPPESGVIAKAACGALEFVSWARAVNLARALDEIAEAGYWRIGLVGEADELLQTAIGPSRIAMVLGAEGEGLRHHSLANCDLLAKRLINPPIESHHVP